MQRIRSTILGIPVDRVSVVELRGFLRRAFAGNRTQRIVTLNPEIAVAAYRDGRYGSVVRTADLVTIDGVGVRFALRIRRRPVGDRITGTILLEEACALAAADNRTAVFLLRHDGLTAPPVLRATLKQRWPTLAVAIAAVDPERPLDAALARAMNDHAPALLVTNFGHPMQEQWIAEHVDQFPTVRVAFGVGGAIDYLTGSAPLPPEFVRRYGIEWLWRFVRQPWRIGRIATAIIRFPLLAARRA